LKAIVRSPGSATVINAISTGCGSAFGINLHVTVKASLKPSKKTFTADRDVDTTLMEICVDEVLKKLEVDTGIDIKTSSTLPVASGLSSSSATSNAVVLATYQALLNDGLVSDGTWDDKDILNLAIDASLKAGVTITGAFDDASASYWGGISITDNLKRTIIKKEKWEEQNILIYMPDKKSPTAQSDVKRMKLLARTTAFEVALLLESPEATGRFEWVFTLTPVFILNLSITLLTERSISLVSTSLSAVHFILDDFNSTSAVT